MGVLAVHTAAVTMLMFFLAADKLTLQVGQRQRFTGLCLNLGILYVAVAFIIRVFTPDNNGNFC